MMRGKRRKLLVASNERRFPATNDKKREKEKWRASGTTAELAPPTKIDGSLERNRYHVRGTGERERETANQGVCERSKFTLIPLDLPISIRTLMKFHLIRSPIQESFLRIQLTRRERNDACYLKWEIP